MNDDPDVETFWREACAACGLDPATSHDVFAFGDSPELADELAALVADGPKRATAGLSAAYAYDQVPLPQVGGHSIALDGQGRPAALIRTTEVRVAPFSTVDSSFAWDEGEGDRSLEFWKRAHEAFFRRECARIGLVWSESVAVVFERFRLIYPQPTNQPPG